MLVRWWKRLVIGLILLKHLMSLPVSVPVASESTTQDLLNGRKKGACALWTFVENRLLSSSKCFYMKRCRIKLWTISDIQKKKSLQTKEGKIVVYELRKNLFARMIVIGQNRKLDLHNLHRHELDPIPWSLASYDGSITKTNKVTLPKLLEDNVAWTISNSYLHKPQLLSGMQWQSCKVSLKS